MTANTTTVIYPQLVSIFSYGFQTTAGRHPHASTDALYIGFALKTLKDHLHDASTRTANTAREHTHTTRSTSTHELTNCTPANKTLPSHANSTRYDHASWWRNAFPSIRSKPLATHTMRKVAEHWYHNISNTCNRLCSALSVPSGNASENKQRLFTIQH